MKGKQQYAWIKVFVAKNSKAGAIIWGSERARISKSQIKIQQKLNQVKTAYDEANITTRDIVTNQEVCRYS